MHMELLKGVADYYAGACISETLSPPLYCIHPPPPFAPAALSFLSTHSSTCTRTYTHPPPSACVLLPIYVSDTQAEGRGVSNLDSGCVWGAVEVDGQLQGTVMVPGIGVHQVVLADGLDPTQDHEVPSCHHRHIPKAFTGIPTAVTLLTHSGLVPARHTIMSCVTAHCLTSRSRHDELFRLTIQVLQVRVKGSCYGLDCSVQLMLAHVCAAHHKHFMSLTMIQSCDQLSALALQ